MPNVLEFGAYDVGVFLCLACQMLKPHDANALSTLTT